MTHAFDVPDPKKIRLIVNTDARTEAADQFAIVPALLPPRFIIQGIIAAHFGQKRRTDSMQASYDEVLHCLKLMGLDGQVPVFKGATRAIPDEQTPEMSEGAELIIRAAMSDDPRRLYVVFLGPITDLASAYLREPRIAGRLTAIWIGGGAYPAGGPEFNLGNDIHAANVILGSPIELWQVPRTVYTTMRVSIAELAWKVRPCGAIGNYLYQQLIDFNNERGDVLRWPKGEMWSLGDSPAISLLIDEHEYGYEVRPAPRFTPDQLSPYPPTDRMIRVYHFVDPRFTLEDMFAKLHLHYPPGK